MSQVVVDVAPVSALEYDFVRSQNTQVLGYRRLWNLEGIFQIGDCQFAVSKFFNDQDAQGVREHSEKAREFLRNDFSIHF